MTRELASFSLMITVQFTLRSLGIHPSHVYFHQTLEAILTRNRVSSWFTLLWSDVPSLANGHVHICEPRAQRHQSLCVKEAARRGAPWLTHCHLLWEILMSRGPFRSNVRVETQNCTWLAELELCCFHSDDRRDRSDEPETRRAFICPNTSGSSSRVHWHAAEVSVQSVAQLLDYIEHAIIMHNT